ncbi:hypothetical protein [Sphingobacterium sp.]|uniref:hypothetical protein n=1 Tax=Sphingobacterium sp. TaxID=341027 RepID=UPI0028AEEC78|nr:hypothetical protein [Sphingobacterium sp.]
MNFDDLKKAWEEEGEGKDLKEVQLSVDHANNAIDKVRANMRLDFYGLLVLGVLAIVGLSYVGLKVDIQPIVFFTIVSFAFLFFSLMFFFCFKFYKFYKRSYNLSYDSRDNLMWFYYELRYFIDFYHTFFFVAFVMGLASGLSIGLMTATLEMDQGSKDAIGRALTFGFAGKLIYFGSMGTIIVGGTFLFRWLIQKMYGRYLKQIKQTLDLLKPED